MRVKALGKTSLRDISVWMEPQHLGSIDGGQALNVGHVLLHSLAQWDFVAIIEAK